MIAALRCLQLQYARHGGPLSHIQKIATNDGKLRAPTAADIDVMCESINFGENSLSKAAAILEDLLENDDAEVSSVAGEEITRALNMIENCQPRELTATCLTADEMIAVMEVARLTLSDPTRRTLVAASMDMSDSHANHIARRLEATMNAPDPLFQPNKPLDLFMRAYAKWNLRIDGAEDDLHHAAETASMLPTDCIMSPSPFVFGVPTWVNSGKQAEGPGEALQRAREIASCYYAVGAQTGIHSMIEWCGVMTEYVKMLEMAAEAGIDPREVDQHHADCKVAVPQFMVDYFTEKLGCQLKPFIRADVGMWRKAIEDWFEGELQHIVCEIVNQEPEVSLHDTEEEALKHAASCAVSRLARARTSKVLQAFEDDLTAFNSIREGDYEVHMLIPNNRKAKSKQHHHAT